MTLRGSGALNEVQGALTVTPAEQQEDYLAGFTDKGQLYIGSSPEEVGTYPEVNYPEHTHGMYIGYTNEQDVHIVAQIDVRTDANNPDHSVTGLDVRLDDISGAGMSALTILGLYVEPKMSSEAGGDRIVGATLKPSLIGAATISRLAGLEVEPTKSGSGDADEVFGVHVKSITAGATSVGLKVEDVAGPSENYAIQTGTGRVQLGDDCIITVAARGFVLVDRTTGEWYRLKVAGGVLGIEAF